MRRVVALRRSGHFQIPVGLALRPAADGGSGLAGSRRRRHLFHWPHLHLHSRAGPSALDKRRRRCQTRTRRRRKQRRRWQWNRLTPDRLAFLDDAAIAVHVAATSPTPAAAAAAKSPLSTATAQSPFVVGFDVAGTDDDFRSFGIS